MLCDVRFLFQHTVDYSSFVNQRVASKYHRLPQWMLLAIYAQLVVWREEDHSLTPLSKDQEDCQVYSSEYLVDEPGVGIVVADGRRNLKVRYMFLDAGPQEKKSRLTQSVYLVRVMGTLLGIRCRVSSCGVNWPSHIFCFKRGIRTRWSSA